MIRQASLKACNSSCLLQSDCDTLFVTGHKLQQDKPGDQSLA
jgi:hypothetical protein